MQSLTHGGFDGMGGCPVGDGLPLSSCSHVGDAVEDGVVVCGYLPSPVVECWVSPPFVGPVVG